MSLAYHACFIQLNIRVFNTYDINITYTVHFMIIVLCHWVKSPTHYKSYTMCFHHISNILK